MIQLKKKKRHDIGLSKGKVDEFKMPSAGEITISCQF